jgi:ribosomal protein L5
MYYHFNKNIFNKLIVFGNYKNSWEIPKIDKISLHFGLRKIIVNNKQILSAYSALTTISEQKIVLCPANKANIVLKIRKGMMVGCKTTLRKNSKFKFLNSLIINYLYLNKLKVSRQASISHNTLTLRVDDLFNFKSLESFFEYFEELPFMNISISSTANNSVDFFKHLNALGLVI